MTYKSTPKDVFLHLAMMAALYVSVFSFITLIFAYIDVIFPDQLSFYYRGILNTILYSTASLIVVFPVYILTSWLVNREFKLQPELREFRLRKWLIYLTLFITAVAIVIGLVTLVYSFLGGELTARFLLKVLTVFVTTGSVFAYYLIDIKNKISSRTNKILALVVLVIVLVKIGAGFYLVGSPFYQRQVRLDEQRINDLQIIQNEVVNYWINKNQLPSQLSNLEDSIRGFVPPVDPETSENYGYQAKGNLMFELCADFKTKSLYQREQFSRIAKPIPALPYGYGDPYQQNWDYEEGVVCFERTIDPELYPKEPKRF